MVACGIKIEDETQQRRRKEELYPSLEKYGQGQSNERERRASGFTYQRREEDRNSGL